MRAFATLSRVLLLGCAAALSAPSAAREPVLMDTPLAVTRVSAEELEKLPGGRDLKDILDYHNQIRAEVGSQPLHWNSRLAAGAASYGPIISKGGTLGHSSREGRKTIRENLLQSPRGVYTPLEMVQVWGKEKLNYVPGIFPNVSRTGDWASVGHYTQMAWATTTDVGCAIYTDTSFDWLICRYSPPGNRDGLSISGISPSQLAGINVITFPAASRTLFYAESWTNCDNSKGDDLAQLFGDAAAQSGFAPPPSNSVGQLYDSAPPEAGSGFRSAASSMLFDSFLAEPRTYGICGRVRF